MINFKINNDEGLASLITNCVIINNPHIVSLIIVKSLSMLHYKDFYEEFYKDCPTPPENDYIIV